MMIVDKDDFTMPGKDRPPQSFLDLRTQQGQINWLAQFLMSVNAAFDDLEVTATIETGEEMSVTTEYDEETKTLTFHFVLTGSGGGGYVLPTMSADVKGGAKVGSGLAMTGEALGLEGVSFTQAEKTKLAGVDEGANDYVLPVATTATLGGVKPDGTTVTVDVDGMIHSAGGGSYTLPTMSAAVKGGAMLGSGLAVADDVLSVDASSVASGTLPVERGGTGVSSLSSARARFGSVPFGTCTTQNGSYPKVVTDTGFDSQNPPYAGARIAVMFANASQGGGDYFKLSLGNNSYNVWSNGAVLSSSNPLSISAGAIAEFIFDGTQFHYLGNDIDGYQDYDANQAIADNTAEIATLRESVPQIAFNSHGTVTDLNSAPDGVTGFYETFANAPAEAGILLQLHDGSWKTQLALSTRSNSAFVRYFKSNTWSEWTKL